MNVAVSNIAWTPDEDASVEQLLVHSEVDGIEVAPTRMFGDVDSVSDRAAADVANAFADRGLPVVAFQSLLYGLDGADLFDPGEAGRRTATRVRLVLRLAAVMGAGPLVFGSPSARRPPQGVGSAEAMDRAAAFFRPLADAAADLGVVLCIEPNPPQYGCRFVTTAAEGAALVAAVDSPGFGLHLDAAAMALAGDDGPDAIRAHAGDLRHFHASAPELGELETRIVDHRALADALADVGYAGVVSAEMRASRPGTNAARVERAIALLEHHYHVGNGLHDERD